MVILTYVSEGSEDLVKEICHTIKSYPHKPHAHACRVYSGTLKGPRVLIRDLLEWSERKPRIDILVNNAGVGSSRSLADLTVEDYNTIYNLNVRGPLLLTQAVLPYLNSYGRIVNIGSGQELGGNGTTVNCVKPGPVRSDTLDNISKDLVELQKTLTAVENRVGTVSEVANIVASLAGQDGAWITSQTIYVSGLASQAPCKTNPHNLTMLT
ncbi:NAD(P)-binding protein [Daldinia sp. FL1419]|nr:NAD(P)-binding protein [Daldinia sp. FL1419]